MQNKLKKIIWLSFTFLNLPVIFLSAQTPPPSSNDRLRDIATNSGYTYEHKTGQEIGINIINYALGFLAVLFLVMIIISGFQWIQAGGNEDVITKAKTRMKNAVIGFFVVAAAYAVVTLVVALLQGSLDNTYL